MAMIIKLEGANLMLLNVGDKLAMIRVDYSLETLLETTTLKDCFQCNMSRVASDV